MHKYIGQTICIEFIVTDCAETAHRGYAYLDGLCNQENSKIVPALDLNNVFCKNQKVIADGSKSTNFSKYHWEICRYLNGSPVNCFATDDSYDRKPVLSDVLGFFFNPPHKPDQLKCGDKFMVTLYLSNGCGEAKISKDFTYICDDAPEINYPDIIMLPKNWTVNRLEIKW